MTIRKIVEDLELMQCGNDNNIERNLELAERFRSYPVVIEIEGKQHNIEVEMGYKKIILHPTNEFLL